MENFSRDGNTRPDLTCLLRNLYAGQEATVRTGRGTTDWFQIGKGVRQGCILSPCLFNLYAIIGDWNAKVGSQETPGVTGRFGLGMRNEAGQRLIEFCRENALVIANTLFQQHKRRLYTWTSPDGQHQNQIDYIICSQRWRNYIQSAKTRRGADCGSDHELLLPNSDLN